MSKDFLTAFIGNQTRARLLRVFIFSPSEAFTLSVVAKRAGVSLPAVAKELKALEQLGVLKKTKIAISLANNPKRKVEGKQKGDAWIFNTEFEHAKPLSAFVHEISPMQYESILELLKPSGKITAVILSGTFMGDMTRPADLFVVADTLNERRLEQAIKALEPQFGRELRYAYFSTPEFRYRLTIQDRLVRDTIDYPHLVLLDKARLF